MAGNSVSAKRTGLTTGLQQSRHTAALPIELPCNRYGMALPSLIFAIGVSGLEQPLREAHKVGIPIIAVLDSDCNPRINNQFIDYIIPGNDDSIRSYAFFCSLISQAIQEGKQKMGA
jgi:small subunit ribosomal protein S2